MTLLDDADQRDLILFSSYIVYFKISQNFDVFFLVRKSSTEMTCSDDQFTKTLFNIFFIN